MLFRSVDIFPNNNQHNKLVGIPIHMKQLELKSVSWFWDVGGEDVCVRAYMFVMYMYVYVCEIGRASCRERV